MLYQHLGKAGIKVSAVSLGSWRTFGADIDQDVTEACMVAAYEAGVNYFDGAEVYGQGAAEKAMGQVFRKYNWPRDTLVVSSKVIYIDDGPNQSGLSRKHVVEACNASLQRMGLDYLDLYFCHNSDANTPMEETVQTMDMLIRQGKVLYWGTSHFSIAQNLEAYAIAEATGMIAPTMCQPLYNMFERKRVEDELLPLFETKGMGSTVWSPLGIGVLTGKYNDGIPADSFVGRMDEEGRASFFPPDRQEKCRKLGALATELGIPQGHMALAWTLKNPHVSTAITGASSPDQVIDNVKAVDAIEKLTDDVMQRINEILEPSIDK